MSEIGNRIQAFVKLGEFLSLFSQNTNENISNFNNSDDFISGFKHQIKLAEENNGWFTNENLDFAFHQWSVALKENNLKKWLSNYNLNTVNPKTVAVIMAGNIPMVGFHDFICVLITGHSIIVKLSSNDKYLLPYLAKYLEYIEPSFKGKIKFTEEKLEKYDAVIATGSDNTSRYFEYYFKNKPSIIRKNRNSVAVLSGEETKEQLELLGEDIFRYYGLGCRNVSKIFVPLNYNFDNFFDAIYKFNNIINEKKYTNNYDYNKAVYLMSLFNVLENGFLMLKEDQNYASPIATVFYEYYTDAESLKNKFNTEKDKIQCIVSNGFDEEEIKFGQTQKPELWDYADGVDTIRFLLEV
ncbi:acyl-CoA reductase [Abyssalbus ytuae]|uniref:Acyl-CoA reductase n=1 Tax=Abyssalbus ytuae TaxID=2926907 RepID=A0A9E7CT36_9FLAO|nr:acyl-CoA reductase [Abyssalbus ytuae]UOB17396.1 acyl-CoA reductase [Abyssalbus ytuae]